MRERFTDEEWVLVTHLPFDAFLFGALADEQVEEAEIAAFTETLDRAAEIRDPLHREIALDYATSGLERVGEELRFELTESNTSMKARFALTKPVLRENLTQQEYQSFFKSVWTSAMAVAGASKKKKGIFKKKKPISEEEAAALAMFAMTWDIDLSFLQG